jgi:protein O-GlcNAc transferase
VTKPADNETTPGPSTERRPSTIILAIVILLLSRTFSNAQVTEIPTDQRLASVGNESKTTQQWLTQLNSDRKILETNSNSAQAHVKVGVDLHALGEIEGALKEFDRALELNQNLAQAFIEKGSIVGDQGELSESRELFRRAVAISPNDAAAHLWLGDIMLRTGDFEGSAQEFEKALRLNSKNSGSYQGLGLIHLQEGDFGQATDDFRQALTFRPGYIDAEKGLAHALAAEHKWPEAADLLKQVLKSDPNSASETVALGTMLAKMGDKSGADKQFARGRELSNKEQLLLRAKGDNNWGVAQRKDGKSEDAVAAFRQALDDDPGFCEAHDNLGSVMWMRQESASAMAEFQAAVRCDPNLASARNNFGMALLYYSQDLNEAIEQFRTAVLLRPGFALAHLNLAKTLAAKQQFVESEAEFRQALMIDPGIAAAHVGLGLVLAAERNSLSSEAQSEMKKGLQLDPGLRNVIPRTYLEHLHD